MHKPLSFLNLASGNAMSKIVKTHRRISDDEKHHTENKSGQGKRVTCRVMTSLEWMVRKALSVEGSYHMSRD